MGVQTKLCLYHKFCDTFQRLLLSPCTSQANLRPSKNLNKKNITAAKLCANSQGNLAWWRRTKQDTVSFNYKQICRARWCPGSNLRRGLASKPIKSWPEAPRRRWAEKDRAQTFTQHKHNHLEAAKQKRAPWTHINRTNSHHRPDAIECYAKEGWHTVEAHQARFNVEWAGKISRFTMKARIRGARARCLKARLSKCHRAINQKSITVLDRDRPSDGHQKKAILWLVEQN